MSPEHIAQVVSGHPDYTPLLDEDIKEMFVGKAYIENSPIVAQLVKELKTLNTYHAKTHQPT
jgi:hypothetical protein